MPPFLNGVDPLGTPCHSAPRFSGLTPRPRVGSQLSLSVGHLIRDSFLCSSPTLWRPPASRGWCEEGSILPNLSRVKRLHFSTRTSHHPYGDGSTTTISTLTHRPDRASTLARQRRRCPEVPLGLCASLLVGCSIIPGWTSLSLSPSLSLSLTHLSTRSHRSLGWTSRPSPLTSQARLGPRDSPRFRHLCRTRLSARRPCRLKSLPLLLSSLSSPYLSSFSDFSPTSAASL